MKRSDGKWENWKNEILENLKELNAKDTSTKIF